MKNRFHSRGIGYQSRVLLWPVRVLSTYLSWRWKEVCAFQLGRPLNRINEIDVENYCT